MENCVALTQFSPWRNAPRRRPWKRQRWRIAGRSASECARPGSGAAPCMYHSQLRPSPCAGTARHRGVQEMAHPARQAQPDETRTAPGKASTPQLSRRRLSNGSIPDLSQARRTATNAPEPTDRPSSAGPCSLTSRTSRTSRTRGPCQGRRHHKCWWSRWDRRATSFRRAARGDLLLHATSGNTENRVVRKSLRNRGWPHTHTPTRTHTHTHTYI